MIEEVSKGQLSELKRGELRSVRPGSGELIEGVAFIFLNFSEAIAAAGDGAARFCRLAVESLTMFSDEGNSNEVNFQ